LGLFSRDLIDSNRPHYGYVRINSLPDENSIVKLDIDYSFRNFAFSSKEEAADRLADAITEDGIFYAVSQDNVDD
jgi:hypothetical protein